MLQESSDSQFGDDRSRPYVACIQLMRDQIERRGGAAIRSQIHGTTNVDYHDLTATLISTAKLVRTEMIAFKHIPLYDQSVLLCDARNRITAPFGQDEWWIFEMVLPPS